MVHHLPWGNRLFYDPKANYKFWLSNFWFNDRRTEVMHTSPPCMCKVCSKTINMILWKHKSISINDSYLHYIYGKHIYTIKQYQWQQQRTPLSHNEQTFNRLSIKDPVILQLKPISVEMQIVSQPEYLCRCPGVSIIIFIIRDTPKLALTLHFIPLNLITQHKLLHI